MTGPMPEPIARRRLRVQRLVGEPFADPVEAIGSLLAVQAQDYPGAKWAVGQRVAGASDADLDALFDQGAFFRVHVMRPTWHFVRAEDLRWLQALTGPRVHVANGFQYRLQGIDDAEASRARGVFERVLVGGGAMTRVELGRALTEAGVEGATSLRLGYLVAHAELEAVLCSGPRKGRQHTFALVDERVPPAPPKARDEALAELARRYVEGHGPAQAADLSWWSGLTLRDARRALEAAAPALIRETHGERELWASPTSEAAVEDAPAGEPAVHLLPNYDELLIAFRDRTDAVDPALPDAARVAEAILAHVVVRDGLVVGGWRRSDQGTVVRAAIDLLVALDAGERQALEQAVRNLERFLGRAVEATGLD